jgi:uncharacterized protein
VDSFRNKRKILNDPVYGFITIPNDLVFELMEHPWFQRLRRIMQLGLTHLVYPGALHTRFHHALGAMHLMSTAIDVLRLKGIDISPSEEESALVAILLHDIGHGPFSHALEHVLVQGYSHEELSLLMMQELNREMGGRLSGAIEIFRGAAGKPFLHQLVNSQLDVDRLDYLSRDSYFTGVSEGVIGTERIIKMLNVVDGRLVVDGKGIYSIEKFLVARRLMFWQVYLHKTVLSAETLLVQIIRRARHLALSGLEPDGIPALMWFLRAEAAGSEDKQEILQRFAVLDDHDVISSVKIWAHHSDPVLSKLSQYMLDRRLMRIEISPDEFSQAYHNERVAALIASTGMSSDEASWFVISGETSNRAYVSDSTQINILGRDGQVRGIQAVSDQLDYVPLGKVVRKHFICYPK